MTQVDWSILGNLGNDYKKARDDEQKRQTLASLGQMTPEQLASPQTIQRLMSAGMTSEALSLANLGNNQRDYAFREKEANRSQSNTDRTYNLEEQKVRATLEGSRIPPGWEKNPAGGLQPIAGGPEHPSYLRQKTDATDKGRQMSVTDVSKLAEEGGKFAGIVRLHDTFEPRFGGATPGLGEARNWVGRTLPEGATSPDARDGAAWWQQYDRYKNVVRHELFGAALTATEQAQWERADVKNTMQPDQISKNLSEQKRIVEAGVKRKAAALVSQGYSPQVIGQAFGIDLGQMGVPTTRQPQQMQPSEPQQPQPPAPQQPQTQAPAWRPSAEIVNSARANPQAAIAEARAAIGANPAAREVVIRRLQALGIDPSGL